jgi:hypothetical protein
MLLEAVLIQKLLTANPLAVANFSLATTGQDLADQYGQLWGNADDFIQTFEADTQPMMNQFMGLGVAVAGFGLVARAMLK